MRFSKLNDTLFNNSNNKADMNGAKNGVCMLLLKPKKNNNKNKQTNKKKFK